MQISSQDKQALTLALSEAIREAEVSEWGTSCEAIELDETTDALRKRLAKLMDSEGLDEFVSESLQRSVLEAGIDLNEEEVKIRSLAEFDDHVSLARKVINELEALPKTYKIYVRGPKSISELSGKLAINLKISDQLSLRDSNTLKDEVKFFSNSEQFDDWNWFASLGKEKRKFADNWLYFEYKITSGMISRRRSKYVEAMQDEIRAFYGACLAHGIFVPYGFSKEKMNLIFMSDQGDGLLVPHQTMDSDVDQATFYRTDMNFRRKVRSQDKRQLYTLLSRDSALARQPAMST